MVLEQFNLDGQVAIVTGAGRGVGQGIARVLAEAGAEANHVKRLMAHSFAGTWAAALILAPAASADPSDTALLTYLAAHHVTLDADTAIRAARFACAGLDKRLATSTIGNTMSRQLPHLNGSEWWVIAGARDVYCPQAGR